MSVYVCVCVCVYVCVCVGVCVCVFMILLSIVFDHVLYWYDVFILRAHWKIGYS